MTPKVLPLFPDIDTSFMARGACKGKGELFFPPAGGDVKSEARAICRGCPVLVPCGAYADATDPEGVWAGLSQKERRRARKGRA
jgi:hypothetical protein